MTTRRRFLVALGTGAFAAPLTSLAQQKGKVWRIGFIDQSSRKTFQAMGEHAFTQGLRELGYVEPKNVVIEWRFADNRIERLPELAAELVQLKVDLIFARATPAALAAKRATSTIPIVILGVADPVGSGLANSLARPGGNVTGTSNLSSDLSAKQVQLIAEIVPKINRVTVIRNPGNASSALQLREAQAAARSLNLQVQVVDVRDVSELDDAFAAIVGARAMGLMVLSDASFLSARQRFAEVAAKHRLPVVYARGEYADSGGLLSYGPRLPDEIARAVTYIDRIFKGAKPGELPIEQPTKFELVVNMKTAKALGITIPQSVLVRADRVIE